MTAPTADLAHAIGWLGFVQADPIRAPARAQDLILRHRVRGYRAGDFERWYPVLDVEEDFLYAHGFVPAEVPRLHPRYDPHGPEGRHAPASLAAEVLAFGRERVRRTRATWRRGSGAGAPSMAGAGCRRRRRTRWDSWTTTAC